MVIERPKAWYVGKVEDIRSSRTVLMERLDDTMVSSEWQAYFDFLRHWFSMWDSRRRLINEMVSKGGEKIKRRIKEYQEAFDADILRPGAQMAQKIEIVEALKDLSWIDAIVEGA